MELLPLTLRKNGITYIQVFRGERSCIYHQMYSTQVKYFEVFEIRVRPSKELFGTLIPEKEIFPPDEAFGSWAWTFHDFSEAKAKFDDLERQAKLSDQ